MQRNEHIESQIRLYTDDYELREIDLAAVDIDASFQNNNRDFDGKPLDKANVDQMVSAVRAGVVLPPIIVNRAGDKYLVIEGNHRCDAYAKMDRTTAAAYVVQVDQETYQQMCLSGNAFNGKPLTPAARMAHAIAQVDLGLPATVVGGIWGIEPKSINVAIRQRDGRRKAQAAGLTRQVIKDGIAEQLYRLEVPQIEALGPDVTKATVDEVRAATNAILQADASSRAKVAAKQAGVLEQKRVTRTAPKTRSKQAMSVTQARQLAKKLLDGVTHNRSLVNDSELSVLLTRLMEVTSEPEKRVA